MKFENVRNSSLRNVVHMLSNRAKRRFYGKNRTSGNKNVKK